MQARSTDGARPATDALTRPERSDVATVDYFDSHPHHYSSSRIEGVADLVREYIPADATICDVGAGGGETIERLARQLGITRVTALDVSRNSLQRAAERLPDAETALVSILDDEGLRRWHRQFDVVLVAAVLHHLVGPTRRASSRDAQHGLTNACKLVKPGGLVIVLEPVFTPRFAMWGVFWLKRLVSRFTDTRVPIFGYWNNIGAPIVSFYSSLQVRRMTQRAGANVLREAHLEQQMGYADVAVTKHNVNLVARVPVAG